MINTLLQEGDILALSLEDPLPVVHSVTRLVRDGPKPFRTLEVVLRESVRERGKSVNILDTLRGSQSNSLGRFAPSQALPAVRSILWAHRNRSCNEPLARTLACSAA